LYSNIDLGMGELMQGSRACTVPVMYDYVIHNPNLTTLPVVNLPNR